jgi:PKD repeat protein
MYRTSWDIANPTSNDTYVYLRNSGHDGHNYWNEHHSGTDVIPICQVQTSSHDGADNGHYGVYRAGEWLAENAAPQGNTDMHNCVMIDGKGGAMDDLRGYQADLLKFADCVGAVDSDYGNALDVVLGRVYSSVITGGDDGYRRYLFVIRDPMYVLVADEVESGHTTTSKFFCGMPMTKVSDSLYTTTLSRNELLYPASGFTASGGEPISISTTGGRLLWMVHANPSGVSFSKSYPGNVCVATIGSDTVVYNPTGGTYSQSGISGNAKLFSQRTGGALIFKATSATGSQYGVSCDVAVNLSVKGRKASICVYGTGNHTVTVTSPYGTDAFANVPAGQTVARVLTGRSTAPPVADFMAVPLSGWNTYVEPEFISFSSGWITDYLWEFGDGEWSTEMAPHHKYISAGIYTVKLTVAGPGGSSSVTRSNYITINDFSNYNWPDYILTSTVNTFAAFTSALTSIEASQTLHYTEKPEWCHNGSWTPWCDVVSTLQGHGGGGRILFGFSNTVLPGSWDTRIDPLKSWGDSNGKYDWVGDNLIIDGEDRNIGFKYTGSADCGQSENGQALRLHGCDNIVKNFVWEGFHDGIHMRHGMRMLFEGITNMTVCEDTLSANGVGGSCQFCTSRNNTFGPSADKTQMYSTADGRNSNAPGFLVINGMHSTDGCQAIRMTSSDGGTKSILIVRNSRFEGNAQGPRFGGKMDDKPPAGKAGAFCIYENNYSTESKNGCGGIRVGEGIHMIIRGNTFENCTGNGIMLYTTAAYLRIEGNLFKNNAQAAIDTDISDPCDTKIDLGGGLVDVWEIDPTGAFYGASAAARVAVPSYGQNTFQGNGGGHDVVNRLTGTPQAVLKAENNFWDHSDVSSVLSNDVTGSVDVDPLGANINNP